MADDVLSWRFGAVTLLVMLMTAAVAGRLLRIAPPRCRNAAIDGLRGYLAVGVFLHHAAVFHFFAVGGKWTLPPKSVYTEMGWNCVGLFFMITAFLFVGKLLDARQRPIDWLALFTGRVLRLGPLYWLAVVAMLVMVGLQTGWHAVDDLPRLWAEVGQWLLFSVTGTPDINGDRMTVVFTAGVSWTLAYEWMFYLALPVLAVLLRVRVPAVFVIAGGLLLVAVLIARDPGTYLPTAFAEGAAAAVVARRPALAAWLRRPLLAPLIFAAAAGALFLPPSTAGSLLTAVAFCCVACGNGAWGVLSNRAAVALGDVSYGVYLLHGLVLAIAGVFVIGLPTVGAFAPSVHWVWVGATGVAVVFVASLSYRFVELPAMRRAASVVAWLRGARRPALVAP